MNQFLVHLYPMVRVKLNVPVTATSYEEAVEKAEELVKLHDLFDCELDQASIEATDESMWALVDVVSDDDYDYSRWVHMDVGRSFGDRALTALRALVETVRGQPGMERDQTLADAEDLLTEIDEDVALQKKEPK